MMIKFPFVNSDNALSVIELTSCEVSRQTFGNADLGTSVCGSSGLCNGANRVCPTGVITCACNIAPTLSALLGRFLLQNSPPFSDTTQVQVEATYNLRNAVGFPAYSEQAIADAYAALGLGTLDILKTDSMFAAAFGVDRANVWVRSFSGPTMTQSPKPTPAPPPPTTENTTVEPTAAPHTPASATCNHLGIVILCWFAALYL